MSRQRYILVVFLALACVGCQTTTPVAQVRLVGKAFEDLNAASAPLFDDFAIAERANGKKTALIVAGTHGGGTAAAPNDIDPCPGIGLAQIIKDKEKLQVQDGFCNAHAYYYSELTDPPVTAIYRRSMAAIQGYTNVLLILAEGRNIEAAQADIQSLVGNVGGVLDIAGAGAVSAGLKVVAEAAKPLLDIAARGANAKELARNVKDVSPNAVAVISSLRKGAPELFTLLTEQSLARFRTTGLTNAEVAAAEAARIDMYRVAVSNYIVLLDQYERLLEQLVAAYDAEGDTLSLAGLVEQSAQLSAQADAWRRTYSALRMGL